jgi:hypothetical protein
MDTGLNETGERNNQWVRRAIYIARWSCLVAVGLLLWLFGLAALGVPAELPHWRHAAGAVLLSLAVILWLRAMRA